MTRATHITTDDSRIRFFADAAREQALAALVSMFNKPRGLAVITGEPGVGVRALIDMFFTTIRDHDAHLVDLNCATIDVADNTVMGVLVQILEAFGYELPDATQSELLSMTRVIFEHQQRAGLPPVIVFEHADRATPKVLSLICQLAEVEHRGHSACRIILTGNAKLIRIVNAERMRPVGDRLSCSIALEPLSNKDAHRFIEELFAHWQVTAHDNAADSLVHLTKGRPGLIILALQQALANHRENRALGSADILLALESDTAALPERSEDSQAAKTQIRKIALDIREVDDFDEGRKARELPSQGLGTILVNCNGKLLRRYVVSRRKVLVGRAPHNDIVLDSKWVSRHHAIIVCDTDHASLVDINSTNGMTVNSREVRQQVLRHNDIVVIGDFRLKYINEAARRLPETENPSPLTETRVLRTLKPAASDETPEPAEDKPNPARQ